MKRFLLRFDATALCKMAKRGQITGGILDGPLAFDNAISMESAPKKALFPQLLGTLIFWWFLMLNQAICFINK